MIFAFDPGKINTGFAIRDDVGELLETGVLTPPTDVHQIPRFVSEQVRALLVKGIGKPNIVIERYMFRGSSSVAAEYVNLIIGAIQMMALELSIPCYLVTASQWKCWLTRQILEQDPERKSSRCIAWWWFKKPGTDDWLETEHEADAAGIADYGYRCLIAH